MSDDAPDDPVERVRAALRALGHAADVMVMPESTHTAAMAAAAAGCELGQIVKTLVVLAGGRPLFVLVAGDRRLDDRLVAARFGVGRKQVKLANAEQVRELTGYPVGGVSPFGTPQPLATLIDAALARFETVWVAGGTANAIFPVGLGDLLRLTGGEIAEIST